MVDIKSFLAGDFQPTGVEPELMEHRGVDVRDVVTLLDGVEAQLVGRAVDHAAL